MIKKRENKGQNFRQKEGEGNTSASYMQRNVLTEEKDDGGATVVVKASDSNSNKNKATEDEFVGGRVTAVYTSNRDANSGIDRDSIAFRTSEIDTAADRDARAMLERNIKLSNEQNDEQVYRGQNAYQSFTKRDATQAGLNKVTGTQGPLRAPSFIRSTTVMDYKPDVCKDYKETGNCGYGDSCKFLHDRSDYKAGWQLEKEWEMVQNKKRQRLQKTLEKYGKTSEEDLDPEVLCKEVNLEGDDNEFAVPEEEELPFACFICREPFKNPVVTICGHYYCADCTKSVDKVCAVCDKPTLGVFNTAKKLIKKLEIQNASIAPVPTVPKRSKGSWEVVS